MGLRSSPRLSRGRDGAFPRGKARMDVKEQELLGPAIDGHWYYRAKSAAMLRMLRGQAIRRVVDIGAGSGFFARRLHLTAPIN